MDPAKLGTMHLGEFRLGVTNDLWDQLLQKFENIASCDLTRRKLVLGDRDATTGWYAKTYVESTVESLFFPRGASRLALQAGTYVRLDAVLLTADPLERGDEIYHSSGDYYEVKGVKPYYVGESFYYRECDLTHLPLHGLTYSDLAPTVTDARSNTRTYWETYLDKDKLNQHRFIVCYADPDYPLPRVFKDKHIDIVFAVDQPNSTPMLGHDAQTDGPYGYEEHVPTDVVALNTQLMHLGGAELRRITETYPQGSLRTLETMTPNTIKLGSHTLYSQRHVMNYQRGIT